MDDHKIPLNSITVQLQRWGTACGAPAVFVELAADRNNPLLTCTPRELMNAITQICTESGNNDGVRHVLFHGNEPLAIPGLLYVVGHLAERTNLFPVIDTGGAVSIPYSILPLAQDDQVEVMCTPNTVRLGTFVDDVVRHWRYVVEHTEGVNPVDGLPTRADADGKPLFRRRTHDPRPNEDVTWLQPALGANMADYMRNFGTCHRSALKYGHRVAKLFDTFHAVPLQ